MYICAILGELTAKTRQVQDDPSQQQESGKANSFLI
jgi:hypothetical protein